MHNLLTATEENLGYVLKFILRNYTDKIKQIPLYLTNYV